MEQLGVTNGRSTTKTEAKLRFLAHQQRLM